MNIIEALSPPLPPDARHYYNAHFPGLYSIVLAKQGDLLTRAFIAKPGQLHPDLVNPESPFLWHEHGYDFVETTVLGSVVNRNVEHGPGRLFYEYTIDAGIDTGRRPQLLMVGQVSMRETSWDRHERCESFSLDHRVIHRVEFKPCKQTGWFCCIVEEVGKHGAPSVVYSTHSLEGVPDADCLYVEIHQREAERILAAVVEAFVSLVPKGM